MSTVKAYHSSMESKQMTGNMALLPLRSNVKGPAMRINDRDVIDETFDFFKANIFFREYEIKGGADRTLIYCTLYISECLRKLQRCANKTTALKELHSLALSVTVDPSHDKFPLAGMYKKPADAQDKETMKNYTLQLRQEIGLRLAEKVYATEDGKPDKWWLCFAKRRFMDKSLVPLGQSM